MSPELNWVIVAYFDLGSFNLSVARRARSKASPEPAQVKNDIGNVSWTSEDDLELIPGRHGIR